MRQKTTGIWFVLAASLFAFIWLYQKFLQPTAATAESLISGLRAADITRVQISPAGQREIVAVRSNGVWMLQKPLTYPAQAAAVQSLAGALEKLVPATRLSATDLRSHKNADAEYGFESPQFTLLVEAGDQRRQLLVGNKTAPGD